MRSNSIQAKLKTFAGQKHKKWFIIAFLVIATCFIPYLTVPGVALWWFYKKSKFTKKLKTIVTSSVLGAIVILIAWASVLYAKDVEPHLTVINPSKLTFTTKDSQVTISGNFAPNDRTVEVNGNEIPTKNGTFTTVYQLQAGENKIEIQAGKWKWAYVYLDITRQVPQVKKAITLTPTIHVTPIPTKKPAITNKPSPKPTSKPTAKPTPTPVPGLSVSVRAQIVTIITANTNHFKQLWSDGQTALGTTQYADAYAGLDALNDPTSNASKFSHYKQTESPANDNSMNDALQQADKFYPSNVSDDALNTWRIDMIQLSSDMGLWVNDATSWQISEISTSQLDNDAQTVNKDFSLVEKDIQAIK